MATPLYIINEGLKLLGEFELNASSFTQDSYASHVLAGFNVILRDIYKRNPRWGILEAQTLFDTVVDQQAYDVGNDTDNSGAITVGQSTIDKASKIRSILHPDNFQLRKITMEQYYTHTLPLDFQESQLEPGTPELWWVEQENVYFYPVPNSVKTMTVKYQAPFTTPITSSNIENTTIIPFKEEDINMLILGAKWLMAARLKDPETLLFKSEFKESFLLSVLDDDKAPDQMEVDSYFTRGMI